MHAKLTLSALALIVATPMLAQTQAVITGGPAPTCLQPGMTQPAGATLPLCTASDMAALGGDHDDDSENDEGDDD